MKAFLESCLLMVVIFLMPGPNCNAVKVGPESARLAAENKIMMLNRGDECRISSLANVFVDDRGSALFYIFDLYPTGYVVVTADTKLPPVLAYSFTSEYSKVNDQNVLVELIRADILNRLKYADLIKPEILQARAVLWESIYSQQPTKTTTGYFQQWPPEGTTLTGGWLETNWTQNAPYNNYCPMDPVTNQRSIAGCPAVAMAQIIHYYKTINDTEFADNDDYYHAYAGRNYWIDDDFEEIDFPSFPILNAYLDTLSICFTNQSALKNNEKAALNFACGVAAKQVYTSSVSGTFGVDQAYDAYIRFGFSQANLTDDTDTSLYALLAQHMMEARPVHLAVVDQGWTIGHNLVIDGYNTDNYFHLNFGWGGAFNGWYLLPEEIPYGLTVIEGVITNIAYPPVYTSVSNSESESNVGSLIIFPNPASSYLNLSFDLEMTSSVEILIYNNEGKLILKEFDHALKPGKCNKRYEMKSEVKDKCSPGVYFCNLWVGDQLYARKFILK